MIGLIVLGLCVAGAVWAAQRGDSTKATPSKLPPLKVDRAKPLLLDAGPAPSPKGGLPPLKVDRSRPLRLDDGSTTTPKKTAGTAGSTRKAGDNAPKLKADNQSCFVCHDNYQEEDLASVHAQNNVGCIKCHGESLAHRNDENNITPPQRMYPGDKIDEACKECHSEHNAPATKVVATWLAKCPQKKQPGTLLCTDCHGDHRLKHRTVRWDKASGKLLGGNKAVNDALLK
jgi:hypothetical protein